MRQSSLLARRVTALVLVTALAGLSAACGNDEEGSPPPGGPATSLAPPTYPLTGRPLDDPARGTRPAVSVKIDNNSASRPQAGIEKADVAYEEFTEGITRFIVVFHSTDADPVGPVRSVRPADPVIIHPLGGVFGFSGGSPAIRALVPSAPLTAVDENATDVMKRRSGRRAPHNLYTTVAGLASKAPGGAKAPPPFAAFLGPGQTFGGAGAVPATHMEFRPAQFLSAAYDWDPGSGSWKRTTDGSPAALEGGGQISPNNVILQFTPYSVYAPDPQVQYPEVVGTGDAWIFASGMLVKGRWTKPDPAAVTAYTQANGAPIVLPPGQTWVHLLAPGTAVPTR
ncbi:MAG TPA: DUF3048 domain-containing protein [Acidimicrobiales bacterium]|nr:DUF3048 domain-containing protein [Acidimicrobiales bacterium]